MLDFITLCYCTYAEFKNKDETGASVKEDYNTLTASVKYFKKFTPELLQKTIFTNNQFVIGFKNIVDYKSLTKEILTRLQNRKIKDELWVKEFNSLKPPGL